MTNLERRALLGDRQAQEEATRQGIVLNCPCCKGNAQVRYTGNGSGPFGYTSNIYYRSHPGFIMCEKCGLSTSKMNRVCRALAKWNTRPAPPVCRCGECKHWGGIDEYGDGFCHNPDGIDNIAKSEDFCSYFEPKEREE